MTPGIKLLSFITVFAVITPNFLHAGSYCENKPCLAPQSRIERLSPRGRRADLYSMSLEDLKVYFRIRHPRIVRMREPRPLSARERGTRPRRIAYELSGERSRYRGPIVYEMYLYPERIPTDEEKLHWLSIMDRVWGTQLMYEYHMMQAAA